MGHLNRIKTLKGGDTNHGEGKGEKSGTDRVALAAGRSGGSKFINSYFKTCPLVSLIVEVEFSDHRTSLKGGKWPQK